MSDLSRGKVAYKSGIQYAERREQGEGSLEVRYVHQLVGNAARQ